MGPGADVKLRAVDRACEQRTAESTFRKFCIAMRTIVNHGMQHPGHSAHYDAVFTDFGKQSGLPVMKIAQVAEVSRGFDLLSGHFRSLGMSIEIGKSQPYFFTYDPRHRRT
jgi:hypothetical protein